MKYRKSSWMMAIGLIFSLFLWGASPSAQAAPLSNVPVTMTQPDGTEVELLASGDEYFHYYHDEDGFMILRDGEGWYVYAQEQDGGPVASSLVAGKDGPRARSIGMTFAQIDFEKHPELRHEELEMEFPSFLEGGNGASTFSFAEDQGPTDQHMANLVVFVRFPGEGEFVQTQNGHPVIQFSDGSKVDLRERYDDVSRYMQKISHRKFNIETTFLSADPAGGSIASAVAPRPRSAYEGNLSDTTRRDLEMEMLASALSQTLKSVPKGAELDYNNDGQIDNITFIVSGKVGDWNSLLWPHSWALQGYHISVNTDSGSKDVFQFNFNFGHPQYAGLGVLSHELLHAVGYPDLYRYSYNGDPVGRWDAMATTDYDDPQFLGGYLKEAYAGWGNLKMLTESGTYTLNPLGTDDSSPETYLIATEKPYEYIALECRKNDVGPPDPETDNVPTGGLLIYRVNQLTAQGNRDGDPNKAADEVYVFRPKDQGVNYGTAGLQDVYLNEAALLPGESFGEPDLNAVPDGERQCIYLSNGKNTGIVVDGIKLSESGAVTFHVSLPSPEGEIDPDGAYDVDRQDYAITQSGDYRFGGSTRTHRIIVMSGEVNLYLNNVTMDLSGLEGVPPISIRDGAKVNLYLSGQNKLAGGEFAAGIAVAPEAELNVRTQDGNPAHGKLTAIGGPGCAGIGSSATSLSGAITVEGVELTAQGGGSFQMISGSTILFHTQGAPAIGGRDEEICGPIRLKNSKLDLQAGYNTSISNAWYYNDVAHGGNDVEITGCTGVLQGCVAAGGKLRVSGSALKCTTGGEHGFIPALLFARQGVLVEKSDLDLQADSYVNGLQVTEPGAAVEIKEGASLKGYLQFAACGYDQGFFRVEQGVRLELYSAANMPFHFGDWTAPCDPKLAEGTPFGACLISAQLAQSTRTDTNLRLQKDGVSRDILSVPALTASFLITVTEDGAYSFRDADEACTQDIAVKGPGIHGWEQLAFQSMNEKAEKWDISAAPLHITKSGSSYALFGTSSENGVTVDSGLENVHIYLQGVTYRGTAPFLEVEPDAEVAVTAISHTDNLLENRSGGAVVGKQGSRISFNGTGMLSAAGSGAPAVAGDTVLLDRSLDFSAYSDHGDAVTQAGSQWKPENGLEPVLAFVEFSQPLTQGLRFTVRNDSDSRSYQAPANVQASHALFSLPSTGVYTLHTEEDTQAQLNCPDRVNRIAAALHGEEGVTQDIDLSTMGKNYTITENGAYTVFGTNADSQYRSIRVSSGLHVTVILDGVSYAGNSSSPFLDLQGNAAVTLVLRKSGEQENKIVYSSVNSSYPAIAVPGGASLTIKEDPDQPGSLSLVGRISGPGKLSQGGSCGTLIFDSGTADLRCNGDAVFGGANAKVRILGGQLHSQLITEDSSTAGYVGGPNADVQISGGEVEIRNTGDVAALGGENAHVTITGGEIRLYRPSTVRTGLGGSGSVVVMDGGSLTVEDPWRPSGSGSSVTAIGGDGSSVLLNSGRVEVFILNGIGSSSGIFGGKSGEVTFGKALDLVLYGNHNGMVLVSDQCAFENQCGVFYGKLEKEVVVGGSFSLCISEGGKKLRDNLAVPERTDNITFTLPLGADGTRAFDLTIDTPSGSYAGGWNMRQNRVKTAEGIAFGRPRIRLLDGFFPYDGKSHSLSVAGTGASVSYTGNKQTEPGEYTVTARVTPIGGTAYDLTATLTILKAELPVLSVAAQDKEYDGTTEAGLTVQTKGVSIPADGFSYTARFDSPAVGEKKPVTIQGLKLTGQWSMRYELKGDIPKEASASIKKKTLTVTFGTDANLLQSVGAEIRPVKPTFTGLAQGETLTQSDYRITYQKSGGAAVTSLPGAVGTYQVSVQVDSKNYQGGGKAVLEIVKGHDLGASRLIITAPGTYVVYGSSAANGIEVRSDDVVLLLSGVDIHPASGPALAVSAGDLTVRATEGTDNSLASASGPAVEFSKAGQLTLGGSGFCSVIGGGTSPALSGPYGSACRLEGERPIPFVFASAGINAAEGFQGFGQKGERYCLATIGFQSAAPKLMEYDLETSFGTFPLRLPAGCKTAAVTLPGISIEFDSGAVLYESGFFTLREAGAEHIVGTAGYRGPVSSVSGVSLQRPALERQLSLKDGTVNITQSGTYTVTGDPGAALANRILIGDGLTVKLILRDVRISGSLSEKHSGLIQCGENTALVVELQNENALSSTGPGACFYAGSGSLVELDGAGSLTASATCPSSVSSPSSTALDVSKGRLRVLGGTYDLKANCQGSNFGIRGYDTLIEGGDFTIDCATYSYDKSGAVCSLGDADAYGYDSPTLTIRGGTFDLTMERGSVGPSGYGPNAAAVFSSSGKLAVEGGEFRVVSNASATPALQGGDVTLSGGDFSFQLPGQPNFGVWATDLSIGREVSMKMWIGSESGYTGYPSSKMSSASVHAEHLHPYGGYTPYILEFYLWDKVWDRGQFFNYPADLSIVNVEEYPDQPVQEKVPAESTYQGFAAILPGSGSYLGSVIPEKDDPKNPTNVYFASFSEEIVSSGVTRLKVEPIVSTAIKRMQISFPDESFVYDGNPKSLRVRGSIPPNAVVTYGNNGAVEPGEYEVSVSVRALGYADVAASAKLTIQPAILSVKAEAEDKPVYDGTTSAQGKITLRGVLPEDDVKPAEGVTFEFADANVGRGKDVLAKNVTLAGKDAWKYTLGDATAETEYHTTASILKPASVNLNFLKDSLSQKYDGKAKKVQVSASAAGIKDPANPNKMLDLPCTVLYNGKIYDEAGAYPSELGSYTVSASVSVPNFQETSANATLYIVPPDITGVELQDGAAGYDGAGHGLSVTGSLAGDTVTYFYQSEDASAPVETEPVDAGSYRVIAEVKRVSHKDLVLEAQLTIQPKPVTVTGIEVPSVKEDAALDLQVTGSSKFDKQASGILERDEVFLSYSAAYRDNTPGEEKPVDLTGLKLAGTGASNYILSETTAVGTGSVIPKENRPSVPSHPGGGEDEDPQEPDGLLYDDISQGHWAYESIAFVTQEGWMKGTGETSFSPNGTMTRGMAVTVLYRMAGEPEPAGNVRFDDVNERAYYAKATAWAKQNHVMMGTGGNAFSPAGLLTREQLAVALYRYAGEPEPASGLEGFQDEAAVSPYARKALAWAVETGVVSGKGRDVLDPKGPAKRCEFAAMLQRYCSTVSADGSVS